MKSIVFQPSSRVDAFSEYDGQELTQKPYPIHVREDGVVLNSRSLGSWAKVCVGTHRYLHVQEITLAWHHLVLDPQQAVRRYLVLRNDAGQLFSNAIAIEEVVVYDHGDQIPEPK